MWARKDAVGWWKVEICSVKRMTTDERLLPADAGNKLAGCCRLCLAPAGRQILFVLDAILHIVHDKNKAPRKERKKMKSETIKKTKEIVYLEDNGITVPILKECLDLVHDVRRIIKKNLDVFADTHARGFIEPMSRSMLYGCRAQDVMLTFDDRKVGVHFLYDTVSARKAGKVPGAEGYNELAPDSMIVYVFDEHGISITETYLYSWITKQWTDASDFASTTHLFSLS